MRNYGNIAKEYGYHVSVVDLRNPTRSNGNNLLQELTLEYNKSRQQKITSEILDLVGGTLQQ